MGASLLSSSGRRFRSVLLKAFIAARHDYVRAPDGGEPGLADRRGSWSASPASRPIRRSASAGRERGHPDRGGGTPLRGCPRSLLASPCEPVTVCGSSVRWWLAHIIGMLINFPPDGDEPTIERLDA